MQVRRSDLGPTPHLHAITLTRPKLRGRIALAWRAEAPASPAARAFISHARAQLSRAGVPRRQESD